MNPTEGLKVANAVQIMKAIREDHQEGKYRLEGHVAENLDMSITSLAGMLRDSSSKAQDRSQTWMEVVRAAEGMAGAQLLLSREVEGSGNGHVRPADPAEVGPAYKEQFFEERREAVAAAQARPPEEGATEPPEEPSGLVPEEGGETSPPPEADAPASRESLMALVTQAEFEGERPPLECPRPELLHAEREGVYLHLTFLLFRDGQAEQPKRDSLVKKVAEDLGIQQKEADGAFEDLIQAQVVWRESQKKPWQKFKEGDAAPVPKPPKNSSAPSGSSSGDTGTPGPDQPGASPEPSPGGAQSSPPGGEEPGKPASGAADPSSGAGGAEEPAPAPEAPPAAGAANAAAPVDAQPAPAPAENGPSAGEEAPGKSPEPSTGKTAPAAGPATGMPISGGPVTGTGTPSKAGAPAPASAPTVAPASGSSSPSGNPPPPGSSVEPSLFVPPARVELPAKLHDSIPLERTREVAVSLLAAIKRGLVNAQLVQQVATECGIHPTNVKGAITALAAAGVIIREGPFAPWKQAEGVAGL